MQGSVHGCGFEDGPGLGDRQGRQTGRVRYTGGLADVQGFGNRQGRQTGRVRYTGGLADVQGFGQPTGFSYGREVIHSKVNPLALSLTVSLQRTISHRQLSHSE